MHQSGRPQVVFGVRGIVGLDLTVYGATRVLHSGHYGNWAPNPAVMLAHLIASLRDEDGRILIKDFYKNVQPLTLAERAALAAAPSTEAKLRTELSLGRTEGRGQSLLSQIMKPTLNVDDLSAGGVHQNAKNAIPQRANAALDFRLVPGQTPETVRKQVERHIRTQGYRIAKRLTS